MTDVVDDQAVAPVVKDKGGRPRKTATPEELEVARAILARGHPLGRLGIVQNTRPPGFGYLAATRVINEARLSKAPRDITPQQRRALLISRWTLQRQLKAAETTEQNPPGQVP